MPSLLVFQHVPHEDLGYLESLFLKNGWKIKYVNLLQEPDHLIEIKEYQALLILGGPMSVHDTQLYPGLLKEIQLIRDAIKQKQPVLGICLGAQLIAHILGGEITQNPVKEIGWYPLYLTSEGESDPIFSFFQKKEMVFQWHGETFSIPPGAIHLALSPDCPNQAFRYQNHVYALQFHLEMTSNLIDCWYLMAENQEGLKSIKKETCRYIDRLHELCTPLLNFFNNSPSTEASANIN